MNYAFKRSRLIIPVIINTVIFTLLSILHFYWACGGTLWIYDVLPTSTNGLHRMNPTTSATLIVAFGLLSLALITVGNLGLFNNIKSTYFRYGPLIIALIFFLRAVGDFKFIGFFKKVKATRFAINDTQIFSPLCLFVAFMSILIFILAGKMRQG